jgi:hypothetical protein
MSAAWTWFFAAQGCNKVPSVYIPEPIHGMTAFYHVQGKQIRFDVSVHEI